MICVVTSVRLHCIVVLNWQWDGGWFLQLKQIIFHFKHRLLTVNRTNLIVKHRQLDSLIANYRTEIGFNQIFYLIHDVLFVL